MRTAGIARYIKGKIAEITGQQVGLVFSPVIRPRTLNDLYKSRASRISFSVHPLRITEDLARSNIALGTAARIHKRTGAEWVHISFSKGRRKKHSNDLEGANEIIDGLIGSGDDVLQSLVVRATDRSGNERDFNLINNIEHDEIDDAHLDLTSDNRTTYDSRISFIRRSFRTWLLRNENELASHR